MAHVPTPRLHLHSNALTSFPPNAFKLIGYTAAELKTQRRIGDKAAGAIASPVESQLKERTESWTIKKSRDDNDGRCVATMEPRDNIKPPEKLVRGDDSPPANLESKENGASGKSPDEGFESSPSQSKDLHSRLLWSAGS